MVQTNCYNLLNFLAEGFLQQGASVTYKEFSGTQALNVTSEGIPARLYITAEEEVPKMAFLSEITSEEIFVPVLRSQEELRLKSALLKAGILDIKVYRLSLKQRYEWYSREFMDRKIKKSASVNGACGL